MRANISIYVPVPNLDISLTDLRCQGLVKYAVPTPAAPPTDPAKVRKVLFDMASGLMFGIGVEVVRSRRCTRCTGVVVLDRRVKRASRRAVQY